MKKLKKIVCLIAVLILTGFSLAGCALFQRDVEYYNDVIVATVGSDIKITKKQLVDGFNNFGYQYTQQGMNTEEALEKTLDTIIDREILVELSKEMFGVLSDNEEAGARKVAFDALDSAIKDMEKKVREERKISDAADGETPSFSAAA